MTTSPLIFLPPFSTLRLKNSKCHICKISHGILSRNHVHPLLHLLLIRSDKPSFQSRRLPLHPTTPLYSPPLSPPLSLHAKFHQMPQVDLETLLCGGDIKVSCETMIAGQDDPDMPADSIQIPIGGEIDWTDINAVYERDDSTKGNTNPKSHHANQKPQSNSQRFSGNLKPKAPIIALPNKIRHSSYLGASVRRNPKSSTMRRKKKTGGDRKSGVQAPEPGSPKVSCFGKVLSDREREKNHNNLPADDKVLRSGGCFARMMEMFRCSGLKSTVEEEDDEEEASTPPERIVTWSERPPAAAAAADVVPPAGLGAFRRFSSGRRSASWGGDDEGQMHVAPSAPLDQEGGTGRRSVG